MAPLFVSQVLPQQDLELTECDTMTVHSPGEIQPHGVLIGVQEPSLTIAYASENTQKLFKIPYTQLLGRDLSNLLEPGELDKLKRNLGSQNFKMVNPLRLQVGGKPFDFVLHRHQGTLFMEIEPINDPNLDTAQVYGPLAQQAMMKILSAGPVEELMQVATDQIRAISGYDRVMLYMFDENYDGQVTAESRVPEMPSFLGLHFPSWEIPAKVRELYIKNMTRYIPHVFNVPVKVMAVNNTSTQGKLDMTFSLLRACMPVHIQYLTDMNVGSSTSFSIVVNGKLWAMFACHNRRPKEISYAHRLLCEQVAAVFPDELLAREEPERYQTKIKGLREAVQGSATPGADLGQALSNQAANLLQMVSAEGAAIYSKGTLRTVGKTPSETDIRSLMHLLCDPYKGLVFKNDLRGLLYTNNLGRLFKLSSFDQGLAERVKDTASGLVVVPISRNREDYLVWFRPEVVQNATWAGNPEESIFPQKYRMAQREPKKSFEAWKSKVVNTATAWNAYEVENAAALRDALVNQ
jgi:light-regulated signal transduction histidine kinase (bacteriophytochrome)